MTSTQKGGADSAFREDFLNHFRSLNARIAVTVGPPLVWLSLFIIIPLGFLVAVSFTRTGGAYQIIWSPTLENYTQLLSLESGLFGNNFLKALFISFGVAVATTVLTLVMTMPVAYLLARRSGRVLKLVFYFVLLPFFTIYLVRAYSWFIMFGSGGLINRLLMVIGLIDTPHGLLEYGFLPIVVGLTHAYFPYMLFTLFASFDGLDYSLVESALDLGASRREAFTDVVLPIITPGIISGCIFVFVPSLGAFLTPEILGQGKILMVGQLIEGRVNAQFAIGYASAAAMFIIIPIVIAFSIAFKRASLKDLQL